MDKIGKLTAMAAIGLFLAGLCAAAPDRIIYVDDDATGANDGTSWTNAFPFLQDALTVARDAAKPVEIRVAQGVYRPDQGGGITPGNRDAAFNIPTGIVLRGGFAGIGAADPNEGRPQLYQAILSGDLKGNDAQSSDVKNLASDPTRSDNSTYLVVSRSSSPATVLDGLVITGATRAGLSCIDSSPIVVDCVFLRNSTATEGGGLRQEGNSKPTSTRCTFTANWATRLGGAIYTEAGVVLTDCVFTDNQAGIGGGAICNQGGQPVLTGCTFTRNAAKTGGAIYHPSGTLWATNCTFTGNSGDDGGAALLSGHADIAECQFNDNHAKSKGGALFSGTVTGRTVRQCVFAGNSAQAGGAIYGFGGAVFSNCLFENNIAETGSVAGLDCFGQQFVNCTFVANRANDGVCIALGPCGIRATPQITMTSCILWDSSGMSATPAATADTAKITYSLIQGGWSGEGNISADPCFAAPGRWNPNGTLDDPSDDAWICGDYHLKSQAGRWDPAGNKWVQDDVTSPCIDAGDPQSPIGLEPFPNGGTIDMGFFGGTAEASKSYFGKPACPTIIAGDINGDCKVNMADLDILMRHWLEGENVPEKPPRR
jgi:predicted outer membrane repeat protein